MSRFSSRRSAAASRKASSDGALGQPHLGQPVEELGIPESIQGVIAARLDRLTKQERILIQTAAALGTRSRLATLTEVFVLPEACSAFLAALDRAELLVRDETGTDDVFEFTHEMVRQVAYDSMIGPAREECMRASFRPWRPIGPRDEIDRLCLHATVQGLGQGVRLRRRRGAKCVARSAFADATSYFELAIDALDRTPLSRRARNPGHRSADRGANGVHVVRSGCGSAGP